MSLSWREARGDRPAAPTRSRVTAPARRVSERTVYAFTSMKPAVVFVAEKGEPVTAPVR